MVNVDIIKIIDRTIGNFLCIILSIFSFKKPVYVKKNDKILFIQLWSLGETILTLPAIYAVKEKYKENKIFILATERNKAVYYAAGIRENVITISLNPISILIFMLNNFKKYDVVIDLEEFLNISALISFMIGKKRIGFSNNLRGLLYNSRIPYNDNQHVTKTFLSLTALIGAYYTKEDMPKLNYLKEEDEKIKKMLKNLRSGFKTIGIVPGAAESAKSRMWPKERFVEICIYLIEEKMCNIVFIGSKAERELCENIITEIKNRESNKNYINLNERIINSAGIISLGELFSLIKKIDLLITNDTGPLHVASAQNTRMIALFGPNTPVRFGPYNKDSIAIYHQKSCRFSPCINVHLGKVPDCIYKKESQEYQKCMKSISVDEVKKAINHMLSLK